MTITIGSLSDQGWVQDSKKLLNLAVSYYILTDGGQSLVFQGNLINLPYTYFLYINEPDLMANTVKSDLDKLLSRYFSIVDVETETKLIREGEYGILLYASVIDDSGVKIELSKVVEMSTEGLKRVIDVNNYGDGKAMLGSL